MAHDGFELSLTSEWQAEPPRYRLVLTNHGEAPLRDFRLGFSGPFFVSRDGGIAGGSLVRQLANYCEIAPEAGFVLGPGGAWAIELPALEFPIRHWTDGVAGSFVLDAAGAAHVVRTSPPRLAGSDAPLRQGTMRLAGAPDWRGIGVVPWPREVAVAGRRSAPPGLAIAGEAPAARAFGKLAARLFPGEGLVRGHEEGGLPVRLERGPGPAEGYEIAFASQQATVKAATETGLLYGLITLGQILRAARLRPEQFDFPLAGRIADAPELGWRGCHLDVARRFYSRDEIEQFLAILAWNKLNVLHWHLSDDEAWRVEIAALPQLTEIGAWRGHGLPLPPLLGSGPEPSGGFYRQADIEAVVALAGEFGVDVVPEIDMPGHCYALLQALPHLRDPGENGLYRSIQQFPNNCLNPAQPKLYPVLETILDELCALFPSRYFHLGADEVPGDAWASSQLAQQAHERRGTSGAAALQAELLRHMQEFLAARGKITGAWEEAAHGGGLDKSQCYLVGWQNVAVSRTLAGQGYDVVVAPAQAYYLDMANSPDWHECGAAWAGWSSPETTYAFDPAAGWSAAERQHLLGIQGCIWSEPMHGPAIFDRLVFPRLSAIAETGWTAPERRDFRRFSQLAGLMPNLYRHREGE